MKQINLKTFDIVLAGFLLLLVVGAFFYFYYSSTEGTKCLEDPLAYAQDSIGDGSICSCLKLDATHNINYCASRCPLISSSSEK